MTSHEQHRALAGRSRARLLDVLRSAGRGLAIDELSAAAGLHPNSAREQLGVLVQAGLVERASDRPTGRGRPRLRYMAAPEPGAGDAGAYRDLARTLAEEHAAGADPVGAAAHAGERWGARVAARLPAATSESDAVQRLVEVLDNAGFDPEPPTVPGAPIGLRRCPFGTLARGREPVICGVHLGLMRGVLRTIHAPIQAARLDPWVTPARCLAHLGAPTDA